MEDPADSVVRGLGSGEGLVSTLVRDDPNTGPNHASNEVVYDPSEEPSSLVKGWMREVDVGGVDLGDVGQRGPKEGTEEGKVPNANERCQGEMRSACKVDLHVEHRVEEAALKAMGTTHTGGQNESLTS